jgi:hypothetical protein
MRAFMIVLSLFITLLTLWFLMSRWKQKRRWSVRRRNNRPVRRLSIRVF